MPESDPLRALTALSRPLAGFKEWIGTRKGRGKDRMGTDRQLREGDRGRRGGTEWEGKGGE